MSRFKAWPLLLLLAAVYWAKEYLGFQNVTDLNDLSKSALPIALAVFLLALAVFVLKLIFGSKKTSNSNEDPKE
jgi:hypothetical protein